MFGRRRRRRRRRRRGGGGGGGSEGDKLSRSECVGERCRRRAERAENCSLVRILVGVLPYYSTCKYYVPMTRVFFRSFTRMVGKIFDMVLFNLYTVMLYRRSKRVHQQIGLKSTRRARQLARMDSFPPFSFHTDGGDLLACLLSSRLFLFPLLRTESSPYFIFSKIREHSSVTTPGYRGHAHQLSHKQPPPL